MQTQTTVAVGPAIVVVKLVNIEVSVKDIASVVGRASAVETIASVVASVVEVAAN